MINLTIDNSTSQITGLSLQQERELRDLLSYNTDPSQAYFAGGRFPRKRTLLGKRGDFPTGLIDRVYTYLSQKSYTVVDLRIRPERPLGLFKTNFGNIKLYQEQLMGAWKAFLAKRGTIRMPTGFGKSVTMALLIRACGVKTLIVVPNLGLKNQLKEAFTQYFGSLKNITIENIDSPTLKEAGDYDCLIVDEAHHSAAKTYRALNKKQWSKIYYRYFFTATPFRSNEEEQLLMESVAGSVRYEVSHARAVEMGAIVPLEAYYIELPKTPVEGRTWGQVYKELVVNNEYRNRLISQFMQSLQIPPLRNHILCLVKEIAHGNNLSALSGAAFANGQDEESPRLIRWFNEGMVSTLIGTTGVLGEGIDTKPAEFVIIAGLGKSRPAFMQQVGRAMRRYGNKDSAKVIIFKDSSHKWTKRHFAEQCKTLKNEYGVIPVKLDYTLKT